MKKLIAIFLMIINVFVFVGCGTFKVNVSDPETKTLIEGQWRVEKVEVPGKAENSEDIRSGSILSFSNEEVILFDKTYENISYKAKVVNTEEYLYDIMGYIPGDVTGQSENCKVLTISSNNTFIKEIMFIDNGAYIIEDNNLYKLVQVDKVPLDALDKSVTNKNQDSYYKMNSGVLIGLKSEGDEGTEYRTLWVRRENNEINIDELPYILLPRKNGFFKVMNKREYNAENYFKDTIVFEDMNGKVTEFKSEIMLTSPSNVNIEKGITFIGNDYMSTSTCSYNEEYREELLNTYVLDLNTMEANKPIPLGTLTDSTEMSNVILSSDRNNILDRRDIKSFTNFAIRRKQGRWSFYTLNPKKGGNTEVENFEDYGVKDKDFIDKNDKLDITLRVSEKIARHDEIFIPWQGIQKQVPSATDVISSPNENLAVIKTKSKLYIYKIVNNSLDKSSEVVVPLNGKEQIVMAEWAEGDYVGYWTEQVKALNSLEK